MILKQDWDRERERESMYVCVCGELFANFIEKDHWLAQQLRGATALKTTLSLWVQSLILKLMTNECKPWLQGFRGRLRFALSQARGRREEPHHGCVISFCRMDHNGIFKQSHWITLPGFRLFNLLPDLNAENNITASLCPLSRISI